MGGKSKSSNSTTDNSINTSTSVGLSGNDNTTIAGVEGDVNYTDHGALEIAGELASESLGLAGYSLDSALNFGAHSLTESLNSVNQMAQNQSDLASQSMAFANSVNASLATQGKSDLKAQNAKFVMVFGVVMGLVLLVLLFKDK